MGWRVSWYKADKNEPLKMVNDDGYEYPEINGECVANNQGTEFWQDLKYSDDNFKKEIKCLYEDTDCDYYSITKEGFKQIILAYRKRIIEYQKEAIENEENSEAIKDWHRSPETPSTLIRSELMEWESSYVDSDGEVKYFCIDLSDDKQRISGSWKYKYAIFDMIYVYKHFDWNNYTMVVFGG